MEQTVDKLILLPRYSSFAGAGTFLSAPFNVREYSGAILTFTLVSGLGSTLATVTAVVQQSPDLEIWSDVVGALSLTAPDERDFLCEWIRLKVTVAGTDPGVTCWCVGDFIRRRP